MILTANQKRAIRRMWNHDLSTEEICDELGFSMQQLFAAAQMLGLPDRVEPDVYLPTPEEIRLACAKIREGWSQSERESRRSAAWSIRIEKDTQGHNHERRGEAHDRQQGGSPHAD